VGSEVGVVPVNKWDDDEVGMGQSGVVALTLRRMLLMDRETMEGGGGRKENHTEVPYGYLTNMRGL
jgi:hypothetical protein